MHLAGKGWGALAAAFAAVLHDRVTHVTLKQGLKSFAEVAESETYNWPLSALPPNILARFDLTDCYRESDYGEPMVALKSYILSPFAEEQYVDAVLESLWRAREEIAAG